MRDLCDNRERHRQKITKSEDSVKNLVDESLTGDTQIVDDTLQLPTHVWQGWLPAEGDR